MSSAHVKIVKWSFPAFALIIGLLWYKRRRVDRADPGGSGLTKAQCSSLKNQRRKEEEWSGNSTTSTPISGSKLYDSGINESVQLPSPLTTSASEPIPCSPRKVSERLSIPPRKASASYKDTGGSQAWYEPANPSPSKMEIQLGSNPKISNFEAIGRSRSGSSSSLENGRVMKIFENVTEEEEEQQQQQQQQQEPVCQPEAPPCASAESSEKHAEKSIVPDEECPVEENGKVQTQVVLSERDSANHSPVSGVLEGSVTDEARSEGSTDSGKGGSIKGTAKDTTLPMVYEFSIPQHAVGRLIGSRGSFLQLIRSKADVQILVRRHPTSRSVKICSIEGSSEGINIALDIIRQKLPEKKYPQVTLEQINVMNVPQGIPWPSGVMQLSLVEGVNNDVIVCNIVKPNRLFVQLPTHPTYPCLRVLDENMTQLYNNTDSPAVPDELSVGMLVVAKWYDRWVRVCIEQPDSQGGRHLVRFVDYGGYWFFSNAEMRKIRSDYLTLPFQAIEIFLANVQPKGGEWNQEAFDVVRHMCSGIVGQAQIEGYINTNTYVNLYLNIHKHGVISLADELIARGFAEAVPLESIVPEEGISLS